MSETATLSNTTSAFRPLDSTTALRPARLHCPQCVRLGNDAATLDVCVIGKVEFHHCVACGGAWFYEKDCDVALRAAGSQTWPEPSKLPDSAAKIHSSGWTCPCCAGALVEIRDRRGSGASVRRCLVCYGGWLDHNDLKCVTAASSHMLAKMGRLIRSTFSL
jgi:Zn-finger nucleic acid-binding protein